MSTTRVNPAGLWPPSNDGYSHVVVVENCRVAYIAGQVALDLDGAVVGPGNIEKQLERCFSNLTAALDGVNSGPQDLVRVTVYIVGDVPSYRPAIAAAIRASLGGAPPPAVTVVGVASLGRSELLAEVEAVAAIA